jgi:hypothetical protein
LSLFGVTHKATQTIPEDQGTLAGENLVELRKKGKSQKSGESRGIANAADFQKVGGTELESVTSTMSTKSLH